MTLAEFTKSFAFLENAFGEQKAERRQFYFRQFERIGALAFSRAVRRIVETRDDGFGFPLVAEISKGIEEIQRERPAADEADLENRGYCQRCNQSGFYLNNHGGASRCSCRAGRLKEARLRLGFTARRGEVEDEAKKLAPASAPVQGLHEKHPAGFWEDTQAEHDRWMADKRKQIAELERRKKEESAGPSMPDELRRHLLQETVAGIRDRMVQPAQDEDDEEVGF